MSRKKKPPRRKAAGVPDAEIRKALHDQRIKSLAQALYDSEFAVLPPLKGPRRAAAYGRFSRGESLMSSEQERCDKNEARIHVVFDHLVGLTDQVRRLAQALRDAGIQVPPDVGTLGRASPEVASSYMEESYRKHFPGKTPPWEEDPR